MIDPRLKLVDFFRKTDALNIYQKELKETQFFTKSQLQELQWSRLFSLLHHVYEQVPYYRKIFDERGLKPNDFKSLEDLDKLPILTKKDIRENYSQLLAKNINIYKPRIITSGGSTGKPIRFFVDSLTNGYQWADAYRGQIWGGWQFGDRIARIWGSSVLSLQKPFQKKIYGTLNNWLLLPAFDSGMGQMEKWIKLIRSQKIRFISGYVDTMVDFSRFVIQQKLQTHLVAAFPTTAPLTISGRRLIEKAFGCGIFDLYQSADGGISAIECHQHKGLHLAEERCVLEIPKNSLQNDIPVIVTDLFNYSMPFIRYLNGDEVTITRENCACGRESLLIKQIRGKTYHHIKLPNGKLIHSEIFSYYLNNFLIVKHFCAKQVSNKRIILEICLDDHFIDQKIDFEKSIRNLPKSLPGIEIDIQYVEKINKLPNQKYEIYIPLSKDGNHNG